MYKYCTPSPMRERIYNIISHQAKVGRLNVISFTYVNTSLHINQQVAQCFQITKIADLHHYIVKLLHNYIT